MIIHGKCAIPLALHQSTPLVIHYLDSPSASVQYRVFDPLQNGRELDHQNIDDTPVLQGLHSDCYAV